MATRKRIFASEREMESRWEACAGACLQTMKGEMVRIVYPGIRAGSAGPDYKDAVVVFDGGELARGDVELHLRVTDWRRHGHDSDHAYDRVVLHVVGDAGRAVVTRLASGEEVATAALSGRPLGREKTALPCQARAVDSGAVLWEVLTQAGVARLLSRACSIAADVAAPEPCAALVHRTARALGYSANAAAAERLGRMLTARAVVELLAQSDARGRNALLLGMAGLLPSQRRRAGM
ncbi:MAG: DUF2851 family protein, partial [Dehalococcoidia bacterium]|nr:DUF2851 family protein [Dehalococcoidia bacterium]